MKPCFSATNTTKSFELTNDIFYQIHVGYRARYLALNKARNVLYGDHLKHPPPSPIYTCHPEPPCWVYVQHYGMDLPFLASVKITESKYICSLSLLLSYSLSLSQELTFSFLSLSMWQCTQRQWEVETGTSKSTIRHTRTTVERKFLFHILMKNSM